MEPYASMMSARGSRRAVGAARARRINTGHARDAAKIEDSTGVTLKWGGGGATIIVLGRLRVL